MKLKVTLTLLVICGLAWWIHTQNRSLPLATKLAPAPEVAASQEQAAPQPAGDHAQEHAHASEASPATSLRTLPGEETRTFSSPARGPVFTAFADWTSRYLSATPDQRRDLEEEGRTLATARLSALAELIQTDPAEALASAVPQSVRAAMPKSVAGLLEESVNTRGDYQVLCVLSDPEKKTSLPGMIRSASVEGETYRVWTFGKALDHVTRKDVPLNGIAVPATALATTLPDPAGLVPTRLMAMSETPARVMEPVERDAYASRQANEPVCTVTGQPWSAAGSPVALEYGGAIYPFSSMALARSWAADQDQSEQLDQPQPPPNLPTAESTYTEGRKRFLLMRVDFPDYTTEAMSTNRALTLMTDLAAFMSEISYGKHIIAPVGEGTDVTPTMRMSTNAAMYDNAGLSKLYPEARAVARDRYGYDLSKYDFCFVVTGGRPSYTYAGLGYVGGVGFHLAASYFDVRTSAHEFGHNLGLGHANWWDTTGRSSVGEGTSDEYGDPFDTMGGSGGGIRHFSSYHKNKVGWIPNEDCPTVTTSGVYRLFAQDISYAPVGVRGLRLSRSGDDYWVEYRQLWTNLRAMMDGVTLRWVGGSTTLLDMTPGSAGGKDDHPLTIGRTFSEPTLNFHITPLGKANTFPESLDIAINIGTFATNRPPTLNCKASSLSVAAGQPITFTAEATDPNGDQLAYAWDFGDSDYSTDNRAEVTHTFGSAGEYYVYCTVSDMKGGTATHGLLVSVGSFATFTISGHVLHESGKPMAGVRVSVNSSRYAYTADDGSYVISRLNAGSYTVTASEPVGGRFYFAQPFFDNPVMVGPDFVRADFIGGTNSPMVYTPIVTKGTTWRYLDDGSNQGMGWVASSFGDTAWLSGAAPLGYGESGLSTTLGYGANAQAKHITYYFRKAFDVANANAFTNLLLEVRRDDGVVVYLNGAEVYRDNMPAGVPTYLTEAADAVEPTDRSTTLSITNLLNGRNVIAAEVHQAEPTSSDVFFDLALSGLSITNVRSATMVYVASPMHRQQFASPTNIVINAVARSTTGAATGVTFLANGSVLGESSTSPFTFTWADPPNGTHTIQVIASFGGLLSTSAPVSVTVAEPVVEEQPATTQFITTGSTWKYLAGPTEAPANWSLPEFVDAAWPAGPAQLGYGESDEATRLSYGTDANNKWTTYYFRRAFVVADPDSLTRLNLNLKRDDGAVVYLNGLEVCRDNMPAGAITYSTFASGTASDDGSTFRPFELNPDSLQVGSNWVAVEVHQADRTSSDLSFDLGLEGTSFTNRNRGVWLTSPAEGTQVSVPGSVAMSAEVVAGGLLGIRKVEFYANGQIIGQTTVRPYTFTWQNPPGGTTQEIIVVATDTAGDTIASTPVAIQVTAPRPGTALVSFREIWKYLDDGTDQGLSWRNLVFDDRTWRIGASRLGYGGDGEVTRIRYGTNENYKHITTYFRKQFTVTNPAAWTTLLLRLIADDGAIVYLNGREVHRENLPAVNVVFNSLAVTPVGGVDESTPVEVELPATYLRAGTNTVAVELHQSAINSSDAGFDLALMALSNPAPGSTIYLASPAANSRYTQPAAIDLSAHVSGEASPAKVEFYAGPTLLGEAQAVPYSINWSNAPAGTHVVTARAVFAAGEPVTSAPVTITVTPAPVPVAPVSATYIPTLSAWRYWDNLNPAPVGWQSKEYNDTSWPVGPARFGFGFDGERTPLTEGRVTTYFRRSFNLSNPALLTELVFALARDDGAVVYLNGREVFRSNMPGGPVTASTLALSTVNTPDETTYFETAIAAIGSGLVTGNNVVAVEVHQAAADSSDAGFDLQVSGYGTTERRIFFTSPADGQAFSSTDPVVMEAAIWQGQGVTVQNVEFYVNGAKAGEAGAYPYRAQWLNPTFGTHVLTTRALLSNGEMMEAAPVTVVIGRELVTATLITSNSVWRFLDNGSNQGTNWAQSSFNDSLWRTGVARLGYGGDGELTTVNFGPNSGAKYITTYFRKNFVVPPGTVYSNLTFKLSRDDGAVVWLNGREMYRSNMPDATAAPIVSYTTLASAGMSGADEQTFFITALHTTNVISGTNVVAVEVHQNGGNSSDLGFNLELTGSGYRDEAQPVQLTAAVVDGALELSWPEGDDAYILSTAPALNTPVAQWTPVDAPVIVVNGRKVVTVNTSAPAGFYRLVKP